LLAFVLGLFVLDDVDAHLGQHRHHVLDLFGADLIGRQHLVELVVGDVPRAPRLGDHLLDGGLAHVEPDICLFTFRLAIVGVNRVALASATISSANQ
jgi:hypothetical protein